MVYVIKQFLLFSKKIIYINVLVENLYFLLMEKTLGCIKEEYTMINQKPIGFLKKKCLEHETDKTVVMKGKIKMKLWSREELSKYLVFIKANCKESEKGLWCFYQRMAKYMGTRNYRQCRILHRLQLNSFPTFTSFFEYLSQEIPSFCQLINQSELDYEAFVYQEYIGLPTEKKQQPPTASFYASENYFRPLVNISDPTYLSQSSSLHHRQQWEEVHLLFVDWMKKVQALSKFRQS